MTRLWLAALLFGTCAQAAPPPTAPVVTWIARGVETPIPPDASCHARIIEAALTLATRADEKPKRIISQKDRAAVFEEETSFHIRFSSPRRVHNAAFGRDLDLSEAIIPLSGGFAQGKMTLIFANPSFEETNVFYLLGETSLRATLEECVPPPARTPGAVDAMP